MKGYKARVLDDPTFFIRDRVRLAVVDVDQGAYLMPDGTWTVVGEGAQPDGIGLGLPRAAIEAIELAIAEWQGHTSHTDTEIRVLREWLAVERGRVDGALVR